MRSFVLCTALLAIGLYPACDKKEASNSGAAPQKATAAAQGAANAPAKKSRVGESCTKSDECEGEARCIGNTCVIEGSGGNSAGQNSAGQNSAGQNSAGNSGGGNVGASNSGSGGGSSSATLTVKVDTTKPNGKAWDMFGGQPDIAICVDGGGSTKCYPDGTSVVGIISPKCQDAYRCTFTGVQVPSGEFTVTVVDVDLAANDTAGLATCKKGGTCTGGAATITVR